MSSSSIVGVRLNETLEKEIEEVVKQESVDKSTALRMLVDTGYQEWKLKRALKQLREGRVTLWQAARISGMTLWDFAAILKKEEGIEWAEFDPKDTLHQGESLH